MTLQHSCSVKAELPGGVSLKQPQVWTGGILMQIMLRKEKDDKAKQQDKILKKKIEVTIF